MNITWFSSKAFLNIIEKQIFQVVTLFYSISSLVFHKNKQNKEHERERRNWTKVKSSSPGNEIHRIPVCPYKLIHERKFFWTKLHPYLFCCSSTVTDGRVVRRWRRQRGCSPRRDAHRPSNRSRAARPSFASFDLPATPKTSTTPCSSVLFNSPPSSSFGLRMPRILKALDEGTREKRESDEFLFE